MAQDQHHSPQHYIKIWAVLLVLLVISILGPLIGIKLITMLTAFGIALVKAYLVCAKFMHLENEKKYIMYLLLTAIAFMFLLVAGTAPDVLNHEGQNWSNEAAKAEVQRGLSAPAPAHH